METQRISQIARNNYLVTLDHQTQLVKIGTSVALNLYPHFIFDLGFVCSGQLLERVSKS